MIHVVAQLEIKEGKRDEFLVEFHRIVPTVRDEVGCVEYGPTIDAETDIEKQHRDLNRVTIIEKWETLQALKAHLIAPHMLAYRERITDLVVEAKLSILRPA